MIILLCYDNIIILHIYNNYRVEFIIHNLLFMALYFALKIQIDNNNL